MSVKPAVRGSSKGAEIGKIVAIGGGELPENIPIHREIIRLSGSSRPRVLFVPTAKSDDEQAYVEFRKVYEDRLHCRTDVLYLLRHDPGVRLASRKIMMSNVIYVSGGNTLKMMRRWRKLGIDKILEKAYAKGVVTSGISAGAICWFSHGHSDSMRFYDPEDWGYIRVRGLGFVDITFCPHVDAEQRELDFKKMIVKSGGVGVAVDNNAALEIVDDRFRIISSRKDASAYRVYRRRNEMVTQTLRSSPRYRPLSRLRPSSSAIP